MGDVLDVRLLNWRVSNKSTLFTVVESGVIDLPVAGGTIAVAGLTPDEIQNVVAAELKRRAVAEKAQVSVGCDSISATLSRLRLRYLSRHAFPEMRDGAALRGFGGVASGATMARVWLSCVAVRPANRMIPRVTRRRST